MFESIVFVIPSTREVRNIDIGSSAVLLSIEAGPPLAARQGDTVGTLLSPLQLLEVCPGATDLGLHGLDGQASLLVLHPLDVEVLETEVGGGELLETLC